MSGSSSSRIVSSVAVGVGVITAAGVGVVTTSAGTTFLLEDCCIMK